MKILQLLLLGLSACIIAADEWVYPKDCKMNDSCIYEASWIVRKENVKFVIVAKQSVTTWTGIGMAKENRIDNSEFIWGYKGTQAYSVVIDGTYPDAYSPPTKDAHQNLDTPLAFYKDDYLTVSFTHQRTSYEKYELNFTDNNCYYFIFPVEGGSFLNDDGHINAPGKQPILSDQPICFLGPQETTTVLPETTTVLPETTTFSMTPKHSEPLPETTNVLPETTTVVPEMTTVLPETPTISTTPKHVSDVVSGYRRICYYTNWSQHRVGKAKFLPADIDPSLCTHLVFAYANISADNTLVPTEPNDDIDGGLYEQFNNLKKKDSAVITMLAVGGWDNETGYSSQMLETEETRQKFINSTIKQLRKYDFDGLSLDFPCLGAVGSPPEDKTHFTSLVKELRLAFNAETLPNGKITLQMSVSIPAHKDIIDNGYEVDKIQSIVNFINLMTNDLIDDNTAVALHHTALYPGSGLNAVDEMTNIVWIANYLALKGASRWKTNIGMATYGRGFTLKDPNNFDIGALVLGPSPPGECTKEWGILAYYEICPLFKDTLAKKIWLQHQKVPYIAKQTQWVGYDDMQSLKMKVDWLKDCGHGGYVVSTMDFDDFKGEHCDQGPYPLMHILSDTLLSSNSSSTELPMWTSTVLPMSTSSVHP